MSILSKAGIAASLAGVLSFSAGNTALADSVTFTSWGGSFQDGEINSMFGPAADELGVELKTDTLAGGLEDIRAQVQAGAVTWDLVVLDYEDCIRGSREGLFETLDYSMIDTDGYAKGTYDDDWFGLMSYSVVMAWRTDEFGEDGPRTWVEFFDTEKFPGKRGLYNDPTQTLEQAYLAAGASGDTLYPIDVEKALGVLDGVKDNVIWWKSGSQQAQLMKDGEVSLASMWVSRASGLKDAGEPVDYHFDNGLLNLICYVVPKDAPNAKLANKMIGIAATAERQAAIPDFLPYGPVNAKASALVDPSKLANLNTSETNIKTQTWMDGFWWADNYADVQEQFDEFMTR